MITANDIRRTYRSERGCVEALRGVTCEIADGEMVAILGTSGSGKTTFLHCLGGLDRAFEGDLRVAGFNLRAASDRALARFRNETVGFVFQSFHLLPHLSCLDNVRVPAFFRRASTNSNSNSISIPDAAAEALDCLREVGLESVARERPGVLSGGQKQRVAIARALFARPRLLLADEPTGNLDARTGSEIIELFRRLNHDAGLTVVVVTHEEALARAAGRTLRMEEGRLVE